MYEITFVWTESGQTKTQTLHPFQPTKNAGVFRVGRDPERCDWILPHPTVSGLHVEIFWQPHQQHYYLRNLRDQNPPVIDGLPLMQGEAALKVGSQIRLGQVDLTVTAIAPIMATLLLEPQFFATPMTPALTPVHTPAPSPLLAVVPVASAVYGLKCPKCHQVLAYEHVAAGCHWCGASLAAAVSVILSPT
ncbi:FHA domain-containing protein [Trichocoleus sp. FACHB-591]|uniref:FHA domain-containing protein n=1 Tax=Trichocoleus sp. FACHB-591 TaxID=2692872 RepID=UPI0016844F42|nr:FHA domain-containing protein [Trichocoleus sp. FACHB-591]MBD2097806.1 FHA domain-containing protein [Trichocoleus sp. FACHB-591]